MQTDEINCLVYTAHTDTHSYTNSHVHHHTWMLLAANTVLRDTQRTDNGPELAHLTKKHG